MPVKAECLQTLNTVKVPFSPQQSSKVKAI